MPEHPAATPLGSMLGTGPAVTCKIVSPEIAVHWWSADAKPGDPCLCGVKLKEADDAES